MLVVSVSANHRYIPGSHFYQTWHIVFTLYVYLQTFTSGGGEEQAPGLPNRRPQFLTEGTLPTG